MTPATLNLTIYKGCAFPLIFVLKSNGSPVNVTGWVSQADVRVQRESAVVFSMSPTVLDGAAGKIQINLSDDFTGALTLGEYVWDFVVEVSGARRIPYLAGTLTVALPVSQIS